MKTDRKAKLPVLLDHKSDQRVGHTEKVEKTQSELRAEGVISSTSEAAREVIESSENGFEFEASVGAKTIRYIELAKGKSREVNGRIVYGPALIADSTILREISFVGTGADSDTQAIVAEHTNTTKELDMPFEAWLEASGIENFDELTQPVQDGLKAAFEASKDKSSDDKPTHSVDDIVAQAISKLEDSQKKQLEIVELRLACGDDTELYAEALRAGYSVEQVKDKLEVKRLKAELKASKEAGDDIHANFNIQVATGRSEVGPGAIEAALCLSAGMSEDDLIDPYRNIQGDRRRFGDMSHLQLSEQDVELGRRHFQGIGLQRIMLERANAAGYNSMAVTNEAIKASLQDNIQAASPFSSINLPTLFQNVVDRELMRGYEFHPTVWQKIAVTRSVRDFRQVDRVRFGGLNSWNKVSDMGKLTQGHIENEETFVNQADTYGQINYISRKHFINDDLGVLTELGSQMAFWGSMVPEKLFSTYLNDGNYTSGSAYYAASNPQNNLTSTSFGLTGLDAVYDLVKNRKSPIDGQGRKNKQAGNALAPFIKLDMKKLLLPSELFRQASTILSQPMLELEPDSTATASSLKSEKNFHYGRYDIIESPYVSDAAWGGSNALSTTWWMFADPRIAPAIELVFLNGVQRPTVEAAKEMEGDRLGVSIRGYYDLGINFVDKYASVRCKA